MGSKEHLSRAETAKAELGITEVTHRSAWCFSLVFTGLLAAELVLHIVTDGTSFIFRRLPSKETLKEYEDQISEHSPVRKYAFQPLQKFLFSVLRTGGEKVIAGRDGYLFYPEDVQFLAEPGFMREARQWKRRQTVAEPDPLTGILDFHAALKARGIRLILVPVPVKPEFYGDKLDGAGPLLRNKNMSLFLERLKAEGVEYADLHDVFDAMRKEGKQVYLKTDTHWTPEVMALAAEETARRIVKTKQNSRFASCVTVTNTGDTAALLRIPFPGEKVTLRPFDTVPDPDSDVLILGDSFVNIYSFGPMGWGVRSGFAEHLAAWLGRGVDVLARNDGGDRASRLLLAAELARGRDRLRGKKTVVWVFSARKLVSGSWEKIPMVLNRKPEVSFLTIRTRQCIRGTVLAVSAVPRPHTVTYRDHVMTILLGDAGPHGEMLLIHTESMRDNRWLPAAHLRPGDTAVFEVSPWTEDRSNPLAGKNRSFLPQEELLLQEPCLGQLQQSDLQRKNFEYQREFPWNS